MKTTKFIPPNRSIGALLDDGENNGLNHYQQRIIDCGQDLNKTPVNVYDFNRGFEYGIQWALDNLKWLEKYKEYSHYGFHHPMNYEKLFGPAGESRSDE